MEKEVKNKSLKKKLIERNSNATTNQTKIFISPEEHLNAQYALYRNIVNKGFYPHLILFPLRGGADIALCLSHQFNNVPMLAIQASFRDWDKFKIPEKVDKILKNQKMSVKKKPINIKNVLIVDDICDSGAVLEKLKNIFESKYPNIQSKFGVAYIKTQSKNKADFFGKEVENEAWLVFPYTKEYQEKRLTKYKVDKISNYLPSCSIL
jgi:hypoxanthine phosphoribosyltransferase